MHSRIRGYGILKIEGGGGGDQIKRRELIANYSLRDQLSVIKIYFKESQITLCTNGETGGAGGGGGSRRG